MAANTDVVNNINNNNTNKHCESMRYIISECAFIFKDIHKKVPEAEWESIKAHIFSETFPKMVQLAGVYANEPIKKGAVAMSRYLSKLVGLGAPCEWDEVQINMAIEVIHELRMRVSKAYGEVIEDDRNKLCGELEKYYGITLPVVNALVENGYFANGRLSFADLYFAAVTKYLTAVIGRNIFEGYPTLMAVLANVESLRRKAEYGQ